MKPGDVAAWLYLDMGKHQLPGHILFIDSEPVKLAKPRKPVVVGLDQYEVAIDLPANRMATVRPGPASDRRTASAQINAGRVVRRPLNYGDSGTPHEESERATNSV